MRKNLTVLMLFVALASCTSNRTVSQEGGTFSAKQEIPQNVCYYTKYTFKDKHGKVYPVILNWKGHAYICQRVWFGEHYLFLDRETQKRVNPKAFEYKGAWKTQEWKKDTTWMSSELKQRIINKR
jgi:hypothetical protein